MKATLVLSQGLTSYQLPATSYSPPPERQLQQPRPMSATFDLVEPATGKQWASVPEATREDVDRIVRAADRAFRAGKWRKINTRERGRILLRLASLIRENAEELARMESRNVGKPIRDSRDEVGLAANCFEFYAGATNKIGGQTIPGAAPGVLMTFREPVGVCGIIVPWNFPIAITAWKAAPALAMGNTVVLKPAEQTPLTAIRLAELALEAGLPEGVFSVLTGSGEVAGDALARHPLIRKVAFTGSTEVGRRIMRIAADDVKRVTLELGGKSASLVFDDCDFDRAVGSAASSALGNAGQDCCARSRILVQKSIYDRFSKAVVDAFKAFRGRRSARRPDGDGTARYRGAAAARDELRRRRKERRGDPRRRRQSQGMFRRAHRVPRRPFRHEDRP